MSKQIKTSMPYALIFFFSTFSASLFPQDFENVEIKTVEVTEGVYMLMGRGGNIGVSVGDDGVILIDDQYAPLTEKIRTAIAEISTGQIRFVLNTHWHSDHTGGNEPLGEAGALIVAHANTRKRMTTEQFIDYFQRKQPPAPEVALPVVTFSDAVTLHLNGDEIYAFHVDPAHTDGDAVVFFRKANVVHMGDIYFEGGYPFIDLSSGGSVNGVISAVNRVLNMIDENCKVIPGHGPLSDRDGLLQYRDMLVTVRDKIVTQIQSGKTQEEVLASKPTADFDEGLDQWLPADGFVGILYEDLSKESTSSQN